MGMDEKVLVIPSSVLDSVGRFQGFTRDIKPYLDAMFAPGVASFKARRDVENDPSFKQIIPYIAFRTDMPSIKLFDIFTYCRGKQQTEERLHALRSVGIGGHVNYEDSCKSGRREYDGIPSLNVVSEAAMREIYEEVETVGSWALGRPVGLINDDSTQVGSVHLGVAFVVHTTAAAKEDGLANEEHMGELRLRQCFDEFEPWSQHFLTGHLLPKMEPYT